MDGPKRSESLGTGEDRRADAVPHVRYSQYWKEVCELPSLVDCHENG